MATMISSGLDVIAFLKEQHEQIKELFEQVRRSSGADREQAFHALRRLLAVHETAEEEILHPAARKVLPNGDSIIDALLTQEREAKKVLAGLEALDVHSTEFQTSFDMLERSVLVHARTEETEEFDRMATALEPERLEKMRKAVEFAEKVAPTRPHPGVESAAANVLAGPFAAMIDRTRDAFSGKSPD